MSEEAVAFAGRNQLDDPFPIVTDDELAAMVPPERPEAAADVAGTQVGSQPDLNDANSTEYPDDGDAHATGPIADALLAEDSQLFMQALVGIAAADMRSGAGETVGLGLVLAGLGQALAEGMDEEQVFQDLVDAFDRRRLEETTLRSVAPLVAIFVARLASARYRHETTPEIVENLMRSAEEVVGAASQTAGARAWRRLPGIVTTIAERAAHRGLSVTEMITALPRLAARFGVGPRGPVMRVVSRSDHPRAEAPRSEAMERPRRMLISGPVEIVILDR
jgi:hypothetical protein